MWARGCPPSPRRFRSRNFHFCGGAASIVCRFACSLCPIRTFRARASRLRHLQAFLEPELFSRLYLCPDGPGSPGLFFLWVCVGCGFQQYYLLHTRISAMLRKCFYAAARASGTTKGESVEVLAELPELEQAQQKHDSEEVWTSSLKRGLATTLNVGRERNSALQRHHLRALSRAPQTAVMR